MLNKNHAAYCCSDPLNNSPCAPQALLASFWVSLPSPSRVVGPGSNTKTLFSLCCQPGPQLLSLLALPPFWSPDSGQSAHHRSSSLCVCSLQEGWAIILFPVSLFTPSSSKGPHLKGTWPCCLVLSSLHSNRVKPLVTGMDKNL